MWLLASGISPTTTKWSRHGEANNLWPYTVVGMMAPLVDETSMPAAFPAFTYLDPAQLAATDRVDISILARDPRTINTSAPEIARGAGLTLTPGPEIGRA